MSRYILNEIEKEAKEKGKDWKFIEEIKTNGITFVHFEQNENQEFTALINISPETPELIPYQEHFLKLGNRIKMRLARNGKVKEYIEILEIASKKLNEVKEFISENNDIYEESAEEDKKVINENNSPKNIILYGPPGTGKTFSFKKVISIIENNDDLDNINKDYSLDAFFKVEKEKRFNFITFHQSYSYEDFIEGIRPNVLKNDSLENKLSIELKNGIFKELSIKASENPEKNFYLIIDEINRGNISKIFGELITLIEDDKRSNLSVNLPYSKDIFSVPSNLYIIGTMNTADKSIALLDVALRRRFIFIEMLPKLDLIKDEKSREIIEQINSIITENRSKDLQVGHAYFLQNKKSEFIFKYQIRPLLEEYFYGEDLRDVFRKSEIQNALGL